VSRRLLQSIALALAGLAVLVGAAAAVEESAAQRPSDPVSIAGIRQHLASLQTFAQRNGGNRLAGTPGYDASARYVATRMRAAGYSVRFQEFVIPFVVDRSPPTLRPVDLATWDYRANRDFATMSYSGSGEIEAPVAAVDLLVPSPQSNASTSACETSDFARFPRGAVALVQRGTCRFREKLTNAVTAGASAVVVFNEGNEERRGLFSATLGPPQAAIPALSASFALGNELRRGVREGPTGVRVRLTTDMLAESRRTRNVIAETRAGDPRKLVVVGAHLDSVQRGPGLNDNGSGSVLILEVAEQMAKVRPRNKVRFVWWSAEELGLLGSSHYVGQLSAAAQQRHALYLNLDMVGSPNFVRFVYDGDGSTSSGGSQRSAGSAAIERVFARYFRTRKLAYKETDLGGGSDHMPFARAGIPVGGLFTGTDSLKSSAEASVFGGRAGQPYDPCYHAPCDTAANVNVTVLKQLAGAVAYAVGQFARDVSSVGRR
jgi:Zn-dependent M28 family amino/carboxypeptidase